MRRRRPEHTREAWAVQTGVCARGRPLIDFTGALPHQSPAFACCSVDAFERAMEDAQDALGVDPAK